MSVSPTSISGTEPCVMVLCHGMRYCQFKRQCVIVIFSNAPVIDCWLQEVNNLPPHVQHLCDQGEFTPDMILFYVLLKCLCLHAQVFVG